MPVARVDLTAIVHNCQVVRRMAPDSQIMAVVKADAYGHGLMQVARAIAPWVDAMAVARVTEAVELRESGIDGDVIVLQGFTSESELKDCAIRQLLPVIHTETQIRLMKDEPELPVWLKVDTGMHRLGLVTSRLGDVSRLLNVVGVMSHLANSDQSDHPMNQSQLSDFLSCTRGLGHPLSIANSGAVLSLPDCHLDWVRPGIMLFGASADGREEPRIQEAMSLTAPVLSVRSLEAGDSVGYGSTWKASERCRIAVVGIGYADGYPREIDGGEVQTVAGRRPIVGRVSMDMLTILLREEDDFDVGDQVTLWGEGLGIREVAAWAGTVPYTLMTGLTGRVHREYIEQ